MSTVMPTKPRRRRAYGTAAVSPRPPICGECDMTATISGPEAWIIELSPAGIWRQRIGGEDPVRHPAVQCREQPRRELPALHDGMRPRARNTG